MTVVLAAALLVSISGSASALQTLAASSSIPELENPANKTAASIFDAQFVAAINDVRHRHGLAPLRVHGTMQAGARRWTASMVERSTLAHAPHLERSLPAEWTVAGENVGRGRSVDSLMRAFLASPSHRANVLHPKFDSIGVASRIGADGRIYTTHRFLG